MSRTGKASGFFPGPAGPVTTFNVPSGFAGMARDYRRGLIEAAHIQTAFQKG